MQLTVPLSLSHAAATEVQSIPQQYTYCFEQSLWNSSLFFTNNVTCNINPTTTVFIKLHECHGQPDVLLRTCFKWYCTILRPDIPVPFVRLTFSLSRFPCSFAIHNCTFLIIIIILFCFRFRSGSRGHRVIKFVLMEDRVMHLAGQLSVVDCTALIMVVTIIWVIGIRKSVIKFCNMWTGKPEGKRPLGRPRRRWVDNIRTDLQ